MNRINNSTDTTLIRESIIFQKTTYAPSLFKSHQLHTNNFQAKEVKKFQPDWVSGVLILCIILLAWTQVFAYKRFMQILLAPFSKRFINQLMRDGNLFRERISIALGLGYVFSFSLLLYQVNDLILGWTLFHTTGFFLYLVFAAFVVAFWSFKISVIRILGAVFRTPNTTHEYLLNSLIFNLITGVVILPLLILIVYVKSVFLLYFALIVMAFLLIFRFVRGFFIGVTLTKFSYLFLFVYLCSLEILPLLILAKVLMNFARNAGV